MTDQYDLGHTWYVSLIRSNMKHTNFDDEIYHEPQPDLWDKVVTYGSLITFALFIGWLIIRSIWGV